MPIVGDSVSELCLSASRPFAIVFQDASNEESHLTLEQDILLKRGDVERRVPSYRSNAPFDPSQLSPLLDLLGSMVTDTCAYHDGRLEVTFSCQWSLLVLPIESYEAWRFQYPRPGRPIGGNLAHAQSLGGYEGGLVG
ncbi:hypothetical protein CCAX7_20550 [Capsulimonas corticalis]|uniref:Uncharacterized protein n=1 Tax=Capsulimonas corticalis TaxID=2219043 RepID=A0A402D2F9_9BACT|nr:hypothetical protein CCAX7_20550 [Capsulimonas corticalis]